MPDTRRNQAAFPQNPAQRPGLGFPIARLVAVISLVTGAVRDLAIGPYLGKETGETALFRTLCDRLQRGDIIPGDRFFSSFFGIAPLVGCGSDGVFRMHQRRRVDFRRGRRLGVLDHVVTWTKPACPSWLDRATYESLPAQVRIRELRVKVAEPGFRVEELVLVTTLLDPAEFTTEEVAEWYGRRWLGELDLRSINVEMQMEVLRCKSPEMVAKEIGAHLLADNLVRAAMAEAARLAGATPRHLSFRGAMPTMWAFEDEHRRARGARRTELVQARRGAIAAHRVDTRPGRCEPRAIQRRPRPQMLLTVSRGEARESLRQNN